MLQLFTMHFTPGNHSYHWLAQRREGGAGAASSRRLVVCSGTGCSWASSSKDSYSEARLPERIRAETGAHGTWAPPGSRPIVRAAAKTA